MWEWIWPREPTEKWLSVDDIIPHNIFSIQHVYWVCTYYLQDLDCNWGWPTLWWKWDVFHMYIQRTLCTQIYQISFKLNVYTFHHPVCVTVRVSYSALSCQQCWSIYQVMLLVGCTHVCLNSLWVSHMGVWSYNIRPTCILLVPRVIIMYLVVLLAI